MKKFPLLLILFFLFGACNKEEKTNIPDISFRLDASLLNAPYSSLRIQGEFFPVEKDPRGYLVGYAGLILGQSLFGGYCAYDLACPIEGTRAVKLTIQDDKELGAKIAKCSTCGARFLLNNNGTPVDGQKIPLKHYVISVSNDKVTVYN